MLNILTTVKREKNYTHPRVTSCLVVMVLLLSIVTLFACCTKNMMFCQGLEAYQLNQLDKAIKLFKEIEPGSRDYVKAQKYLVKTLIKSCRYKEAMMYLNDSPIQEKDYEKLKTEIKYHSQVYNNLQQRISFFKKKVRYKFKEIPHTAQTPYVLMDLFLNPNVPMDIKKYCSNELKNPDVIEQYQDQLFILSKRGDRKEKFFTFKIFKNYVVSILNKDENRDYYINWPSTKIMKFVKNWMKTIISSGDLELKYEVIQLCKMLKDKTSMDIMLPVFFSRDPRLVEVAILVLHDFPDKHGVDKMYFNSATNVRRNAIDYVRRIPSEKNKPLLELALSDKDWVIRWWAYEALKRFNGNQNGKQVIKKAVKPGNNRKNVILVSIDMLRADRLGCYGFPEGNSPYMDWISKQGIQFANVIAQAAWTKPSHASMFTSTYPHQHGLPMYTGMLPTSQHTISELLRQNSYLTLGIITNPNVSANFGFNRGFDIFEYRLAQFASKSINYLLSWVEWYYINRENLSWNPFYFFLHCNDVHGPYQQELGLYGKMFPHHADTQTQDDKKIMDKVSMYNGMVYYVDEQVGRLLGKLKQMDVEKDFLVLITSDHGEAFGEHNYISHGFKGYNEELKIPLILYDSTLNTSNVMLDIPVQTIDIPPTIFYGLNLPIPPQFEGKNLQAYLSSPPIGSANSPILSVYTTIDESNLVQTLLIGRYKYIIRKSHNDNTILSEELYDLNTDPAELYPIPLSQDNLYNYARTRLKVLMDKTRPNNKKYVNKETILDTNTLQALKNLGYIK